MGSVCRCVAAPPVPQHSPQLRQQLALFVGRQYSGLPQQNGQRQVVGQIEPSLPAWHKAVLPVPGLPKLLRLDFQVRQFGFHGQ